MESIIIDIRNVLKNLSDEKSRLATERFFKERILAYGVKIPIVNQLSKEYYKKLKLKNKAEVFRYCEIFFKSEYLEEAFIACHWSDFIKKEFTADDVNIFEDWIFKYVTNWAVCDTFCTHTMGDLIMMYPENMDRLKEMAISDNRWMRRASAVSLIVPAKKGMFLDDIFEIANILLLDKDDMVQKGYGWMLKVASQKHQHEVFEFVEKFKEVMPRTALRYAIEKMPENLRQQALNKNKFLKRK